MIPRLIFFIPVLIGFFSSYSQQTPVHFKGKEISLKGEWNLVMNQFINFDETKKFEHVKIEVPGTWNEIQWQGKDVGSFGYGTYFKHLIISEEATSTSLSIEVPEVSIAYRLFVNDQFLGNVGIPGKRKSTTEPKIDFQVFDFEANPGDTVTFIFHISNFSNKSGGLWYDPKVAYQEELLQKTDLNRALKLIIIGCILIGALFQLSIFLRRRHERSALYFFFICLSLSMLLITRGDLVIIDLFPNTGWKTLKKTLYLSIVIIGPVNALFLQESFPKFFHKNVVNAMGIMSLVLSVFVLVANPMITYSIIPIYHGYNVLIGLYLFVSLIRAAFANKFGARFLLVGYIAAFLAVLHDLLSSNYVIPAYSFDMMHVGVAFYILQLMFVLTGRYLFALEGKEQLSKHLEKVNVELEEMVGRRTRALKVKNMIIEQKNSELEKAMKEKDQLMAIVAHDLKAPFTSIQGISDMLKNDLKGQNAEFNDMIKKVTLSGTAIIENLTELNLFEQENFQIKKSTINLLDFFEQKRVAFTQASEAKNIDLSTETDFDSGEVLSDPHLLGRITDNLLSNAIKFTPKGGKVRFKLCFKESLLTIIVEDTGQGFTEEDKNKVFQKFQRLSSTPTDGEISTGLGLSIVKTLVDKLGGTIELKSNKGEGARFAVTIPIFQK